MNKLIKKIFYLLLINATSLMAYTDFDSLFCIQQQQCMTTIVAKSDIDVLKIREARSLTPEENFCLYLSQYGAMELYLTDYDSTLVMVPVIRKHILKGLSIQIKLLNKLNKPYFVFLDAMKTTRLGDPSMGYRRLDNISDDNVSFKVQSLTYRQLLSDHDVIANIVNLLNYVVPIDKNYQQLVNFVSAFKTFIPDLNINLTRDVLTTASYVDKHKPYDAYQVNCVVRIQNDYLTRNYIFAKTLGADLYGYLWLKTKYLSYYLYHTIKEITHKTTNNVNNSKTITSN